MHDQTALKLVFPLWVLAFSCDADIDLRPACLSEIDVETCTPLYPPEFPVIHRQVLSVTCASAGSSCHGLEGNQGGLILASETEAYDALLGLQGGEQRVIPGDAACSEMMVRLDLAGHAWSMPPGSPLDEQARCSIRRWIAGGALRTPAGGP